MKLNGSRELPGERHEVWAKLNDPDVLARCIPGCQSLEQLSPTDLKATVALKIGPMSVRFSGDVELKDLDPPNSYRIEGSGSGGVAGRASGGANVRLEDHPVGTLLTYDVDANVSGKIAQLGQRLIDATAAQLSDKFFDAFAAEFDTKTEDGAAIVGTDAARDSRPAGKDQGSAERAPSRQAAPTTAAAPASGRWFYYGVGIAAAIAVALMLMQSS